MSKANKQNKPKNSNNINITINGDININTNNVNCDNKCSSKIDEINALVELICGLGTLAYTVIRILLLFVSRM